MPKENKKGSSLARIALLAEYTFSIYKAVTIFLERILQPESSVRHQSVSTNLLHVYVLIVWFMISK